MVIFLIQLQLDLPVDFSFSSFWRLFFFYFFFSSTQNDDKYSLRVAKYTKNAIIAHQNNQTTK